MRLALLLTLASCLHDEPVPVPPPPPPVVDLDEAAAQLDASVGAARGVLGALVGDAGRD